MEKLKSIIEDFKNRKVLVIGDAILDTYINGTIDRICREAQVPIFNEQGHEHNCGGAANTAINVAMLGAETYFLSVTGKDANARELLHVLKKNKVHTEFIIQDKSRVTLTKKRITAASNILLRVDEGTTDPISEDGQNSLFARFAELYQQVDGVIFSDYGYGVLTDGLIDAIKTIVAAQHRSIIVDAKEVHRFQCLQPSAVKPNYEETLTLLGLKKVSRNNRVQQVLAHAQKLLELSGANAVTVTLDADGIVLIEKDKKPYRILCVPVDNKKAIGSGDTFTAAMTLSLASGLKVETAAEIAAAAASIVVQKEGTVGCTNSELKAYFDSIPKYIISNKELAKIASGLKKKGKKIVFANGCFDILHTGHVTLLRKARLLGDVLIVGVNTDSSIRKLKGPVRPINKLDDRITVLAGLESIDYLIAFEEESPVRLLKALRPDVFVKGGNYTEDSIPEGPLVKKLGGIIKIVPFVEDHSTTHIINKIRDANDEAEGIPSKKEAVHL